LNHIYRVYEINQDGSKYDTEKTITAEPPVPNEYNRLTGGTLLNELMKLYGFVGSNFVAGYHYVVMTSVSGIAAEPGSFYVYGTCYGGNKDLWYLRRSI
jgi:hypothetical protein